MSRKVKFAVIKCSIDGISGGSSRFDTIGEALQEVHYHRGWDSLDAMREAIREWAKKARPGDIFCTQASAIIATRV